MRKAKRRRRRGDKRHDPTMFVFSQAFESRPRGRVVRRRASNLSPRSSSGVMMTLSTSVFDSKYTAAAAPVKEVGLRQKNPTTTAKDLVNLLSLINSTNYSLFRDSVPHTVKMLRCCCLFGIICLNNFKRNYSYVPSTAAAYPWKKMLRSVRCI